MGCEFSLFEIAINHAVFIWIWMSGYLNVRCAFYNKIKMNFCGAKKWFNRLSTKYSQHSRSGGRYQKYVMIVMFRIFTNLSCFFTHFSCVLILIDCLVRKENNFYCGNMNNWFTSFSWLDWWFQVNSDDKLRFSQYSIFRLYESFLHAGDF